MAAENARSVLLTADTVGGVWTYAVELSRALLGRGWQVHLATLGAPLARHQREQVEGLEGLSLHESRWRLEWMPEPWDDVDRAGRWLMGLEARLRPAVVHLNQLAFGSLPWRAPTLLVAHSCVLSWWQAVHGTDAPAEWDRYRERVGQGLQGADQVAAPTQAMLGTLGRNYGYSGTGLVLPNARDAALFVPQRKQPFILAAGRLWDEAKNLAALEAVAPQLPWSVQVAGSCVAPDGRSRSPRAVQALGNLSAAALAQTMAQAAIYALPARYEPFGLSALEAGLCGCALVLGDIPSLREVWGDAARYVPPQDHEALRQALQALIDHPAERARLGQAARERALHFHPARAADATLAAYAALQARRAPRFEEDLTCA
ncbi:glycosyltransferase family 4 protein [Ramlibacter tataouinensis]|uniref:A-glycosyltransferase, Glycosyltransferase Family 4-like protein n=1 Tax=Ramlibacter tataouinensis (strain ATCC BAA-407 / DSM 14655 / LMG 21543 / TTB310) TaxID=365046 RepID=F5Y5J5_RAMTT|nr:glycosyltransferase family 4 protein [Ramlibacter tataouinensis]AEG92691.1 a-glycosyltransferase, Glycosyltransferase Family 4-like protein [Ramlibacter tataouinensis TTB310]